MSKHIRISKFKTFYIDPNFDDVCLNGMIKNQSLI